MTRLQKEFTDKPRPGFTPGAWAELCVETYGLKLPLEWWYKWGDLLDDCGPTSGSLYDPYINDG